MKTVFADTFFFFALGNDRDPAHVKASEFSRHFTGKLMTTGWVLTELADGWSRPVQWRVEFEGLLEELLGPILTSRFSPSTVNRRHRDRRAVHRVRTEFPFRMRTTSGPVPRSAASRTTR